MSREWRCLSTPSGTFRPPPPPRCPHHGRGDLGAQPRGSMARPSHALAGSSSSAIGSRGTGAGIAPGPRGYEFLLGTLAIPNPLSGSYFMRCVNIFDCRVFLVSLMSYDPLYSNRPIYSAGSLPHASLGMLTFFGSDMPEGHFPEFCHQPPCVHGLQVCLLSAENV